MVDLNISLQNLWFCKGSCKVYFQEMCHGDQRTGWKEINKDLCPILYQLLHYSPTLQPMKGCPRHRGLRPLPVPGVQLVECDGTVISSTLY